jgi:serine phosphatase RsbU (regulator of sigma subunit)
MTQRDPTHTACAEGLRVSVRYLPAQIRGGGDIYDVISTEFGLRLMIGDVMGTGVPASETGAEILSAWRAIAATEPTLAGAAVRLHGQVTPERFVTALLVNFDGGEWAEFVCCGHPPPLLLRADSATFVDMYEAAPPLGLLDMGEGWCTPGTFRFTGPDRLLLYTDGVSEARDSTGAFFPLAEHARDAARACDDDDELLDDLMSRLNAHARRTLDDVLMMTIRPAS